MADFKTRASLQYDHFTGTIAADIDYSRDALKFLSIDENEWRLVGLEFHFGELLQAVTPFVVGAEVSYDDLEALAAQGRRIEIIELEQICCEIPDQNDPLSNEFAGTLPISPNNLLLYAFKDVSIKLSLNKGLPVGSEFAITHISELQDR